ncbi:RagB/SusD family nutrient uptake outer membrane protein [Rhabdobacter roseus]|uniref:RagB/SusD family nutrient uptake outer membrane protein n=1 Tax=Rhabdobacter roseus TaxID=1655419 RepID=A0A840TJZ9_9BACT|nr:RagB/SusD family nutrient uptake outer membrane protein [Rhabdobacter roseus]MBB5283761.1 hypothetical protein [Rhabdobacter roseus]
MKMRLAYLSLLMWLVSSCDFLQEDPQDFLSPLNFYRTEADAVAAVNAIYSSLSPTWNLGDLASDLLNEGAAPRTENLELQTFTFSSANPHFATLWQTRYVAINRANTAIERIPMIDMNAERRSRLVGEAKFLRALNYFDLVKAFGDVPLILQETKGLDQQNATRSPALEVYRQIIQDLEEAHPQLPLTYASVETGRATRGAALALLARAYLFSQNYPKAAETARTVTTLNYSLVPNYADIWPSERENGPEHIFSIQYKAGVRGSGFNETFGVRGGRAPITGGSGAFVKRSFYNSFEPGDVRRDISIKTSFTFSDGSTQTFEPHVWKFFNLNFITPSNTDTNWPLIRYSEVLLILAEALNEVHNGPTPEALEAINQVRRRAKVPELAATLSQQQFREAILRERGWELAFEGHRRYDLIRLNKLQEVMAPLGVTVQVPTHNLYPLPQRELDVNKNLQQNPGY